MNILAIAAHPDDIDIFCYGTLAKYKKQGHSIKLLLTTSGNIGHYNYSRDELAGIRMAEQKKTADMLGAEILFLGFDERLEDTEMVRNAIVNGIRWADPDVILTHCPYDSSIDHAITGTIVKQSLLCLKWKNVETPYPPITKLPSVFFFETNGGIDFQPEVYVDISEEMEKKRKALSNHKSQVELEQDYMRVIEVLSAFRGMQRGCRYAEGFIAHRSFENVADYKLLP